MEARLSKLKIYNAVVGVILFAQGVIMWAISNNRAAQITTSYLGKQSNIPGMPTTLLTNFAQWRLGPIVASFCYSRGCFYWARPLFGASSMRSRFKRG